jgi:hypothetical protein
MLQAPVVGQVHCTRGNERHCDVGSRWRCNAIALSGSDPYTAVDMGSNDAAIVRVRLAASCALKPPDNRTGAFPAHEMAGCLHAANDEPRRVVTSDDTCSPDDLRATARRSRSSAFTAACVPTGSECGRQYPPTRKFGRPARRAIRGLERTEMSWLMCSSQEYAAAPTGSYPNIAACTDPE